MFRSTEGVSFPTPNPKDLEELFSYEVFKILKDEGKTTKTFDALDWLAQLVTHIPELTYDDSYLPC